MRRFQAVFQAILLVFFVAISTENANVPIFERNRSSKSPRAKLAFNSAAALPAGLNYFGPTFCSTKQDSNLFLRTQNSAVRQSCACAAILISGDWTRKVMKEWISGCFGDIAAEWLGKRTSKSGLSLQSADSKLQSRPSNTLKMLNSARSRGVYLFLDRRIFTSRDVWNLHTFLQAGPRNAAIEYISALTAEGSDNTHSLHKAIKCKGKVANILYQTSIGPINQSGLFGLDRYNNSLAMATESDDPADAAAGESAFRYRARVMYDGAGYSGWQLQQSRPSIQGLLEAVIGYRLQRPVRVVGAGRTDAGVHARGQTIHFDTGEAIDNVSRFEHSLNMMLPRDVRVCNLEAAPEMVWVESAAAMKRWHAIFSAQGKIYAYRVYLGPTLDPLQRLFRHHEYRPCDVEMLRAAAARFEGTHDFSAFANQNWKGGAALDPVRTVHKVEVIDEGGGNYRLEFNLDGALYKMVRNMVGTMLAVACGRLGLGDVDGMFAGKSRQAVPMAAPAHGLCLERVFYTDYSPSP